jgi:mono/diheme cytochrome c family protein
MFICHPDKPISKNHFVQFLLAGSLLIAPSSMLMAQIPDTHTFTEDQALAGATAYEQHCSACHGRTMAGGTGGPALSGAAFGTRWAGRDVGSLIGLIQGTF